MVEYAYPEYDEHKRAHGRFADRIQVFKRDFEEGKALLSMEIMQFLQNWWKEHILDVDKKGEGEGQLALGVRMAIDDNNNLVIDNFGTEPVRLMNVRQAK